MNYWYSSRTNEIFLDLDSNRAIARALSVLRLALRQKRLKIEQVWLYGTLTKGHAHLIIELKYAMALQERVAWSLWLGNDRLRCAYVLQRHFNWMMATCADTSLDAATEDEYAKRALTDPYGEQDFRGDLLVSPRPYFREPDAFCQCDGKHKEDKVTSRCPAMEHLLGKEKNADYFSRTGSAPPRRKIRVPWGRIKLSQLRHWKEVYARKP